MLEIDDSVQQTTDQNNNVNNCIITRVLAVTGISMTFYKYYHNIDLDLNSSLYHYITYMTFI